MRMRAEHLRPHGWQPGRTLHIPSWCGCTTEFVPVPVDAGWWQQLVPIWKPDQVANPLRRYGPPKTALTPWRFSGRPNSWGTSRSISSLGRYVAA
jgi:hypothetical protein